MTKFCLATPVLEIKSWPWNGCNVTLLLLVVTLVGLPLLVPQLVLHLSATWFLVQQLQVNIIFKCLQPKYESLAGLFSAAIMESGAPLTPWSYQRNQTEISFKTGSFIDSQFETSTDSQRLLEVLQQTDAKSLDNAQTEYVYWVLEYQIPGEQFQNVFDFRMPTKRMQFTGWRCNKVLVMLLLLKLLEVTQWLLIINTRPWLVVTLIRFQSWLECVLKKVS